MKLYAASSVFLLVSGVTGAIFYEKTEILSGLTYDSPVSEASVRSVTECGARCLAMNGDCAAFNFENIVGGLKNCQLFDTPYPSGGTATSEMVFYKIKSQAVFPTPSCLSFEINTPKTTFFLEDSTYFTFSIHQGPLNNTMAASDCEDRNGFLVRVVTLAKHDALKMLVSCAGFPVVDYWVDGRENQTTALWYTADGQAIPMTQGDFWKPDCPNDNFSPNCVRMAAAVGYLWDDRYCTSKMGYICEY